MMTNLTTIQLNQTMIAQLSDMDLVQLIVQDKQLELFGELYKRYQKKVMGTCRKMLKNYDDAQDVLQEIFTKAMLNLVGFQGRSSFSTWLYHISVNECMTYAKKRKKQYVADLPEEYTFIDSSNDSINEKMEKEVKIEFVLNLLGQLKPEDRILLEAKYLQKKSLKTMEKEFNVSQSALKMRLLRARKRVNDLAADQC